MNDSHLTNQLERFQMIQQIARKKKASLFLVGGAVRDYVLGRACVDFDFAASKHAMSIAKVFAKKIKGAYVPLDEKHQCARVARKEKGILYTFDFADYRAKDLKGDLSHRDFTINTLSLAVSDIEEFLKGKKILIDPKKGVKDLKAKTVKMVSPKAFAEDPLRLVRAFSMAAVLDFKIEKKTLSQIKKDKDLLGDTARERVCDELFKIFSSSASFKHLKAMDRIGLLEKIIPHIAIMYDLPQGGYHHLPLWAHSLETVRQLEIIFRELDGQKELQNYLDEDLAYNRKRRSLMKLAAILHDVGKPETYRKKDGKISFHGHERVGRTIVRHAAKLLKISAQERNILEDMVFYHLRPGYLSNFKRPTEKAFFRYFRDTKKEAVSTALLSLADQRSTRGPLTTQADLEHHEKIVKDLVARYFSKKEEKPKERLLTGDDLIRTLKLKPSPIFKKILDHIEELQALGKISTKKEALNVARKMIK